jgi:hypothetical protein
MDHQKDFEPFKRLLSRLCVTFDKFATEELIETWWKALRREPFAAFERQVDSFIAQANDKTKFPKPGQFAGAVGAINAESRLTENGIRVWREFCREYPRTGPIRLRIAQAARVLASEHESTTAHAEAQYEYFQLEKQLGPNGRFSADS